MAEGHPETPALIQSATPNQPARQLGFREYARLVDGAAALLRKKGIRRGTRTLLMVRPGTELILLAFALFQVGAVPVVIDPGMGLKHFRSCVARSRPRALVGILPAVALSYYFKKAFESLTTRLFIRRNFVEQCRKAAGTTKTSPAQAQPQDLAAILFTSGSTGPPKGVCYEHRHFDAQVKAVRNQYAIQPGEVDMPLLPVFALFNPALGMTTVVPPVDPSKPAKANPANIVHVLQQHAVTNSFGSPVLWKIIGEYCKAHETTLPHLRRILMAGASVPPTVLRMWTELAPNAEIHTPYGATECLPVTSISARTLLDETSGHTAQGRGTCLGKVTTGMQVRIKPLQDKGTTDRQNGHQVGEIVVAGPVVTEAYDHLPQATAAAKFHDDGHAWHRMGDLGYFDEQERLWFCGRVVERVLTDHGPLYTDCCEAIFNQHPQVFRSALIGLGKPGHQIPAIVVEPEKGLFPKAPADQETFRQELGTLAQSNPTTENIHDFFFHPAFPVDVRHNAKIHRLTLAEQFNSAQHGRQP